jgi:hypothetical protein
MDRIARGEREREREEGETEYLFVPMILTTNSDVFPIQNYTTGPCNHRTLCSLRGTN